MLLVLPVVGRSSPEWVLRMYRAEAIPAASAPGLHRVNRELARRAGLPRTPELYPDIA